MSKIFYTYLWLRADGSPYYVGKGFHGNSSNRAFRKGCPPRERIVIQEWPDEATALAYEIYQIDFWGRKDLGAGILRNRTDGGEGTSGYHLSLEARENLRRKHLGTKASSKTREKMSRTRKGKTPPCGFPKKGERIPGSGVESHSLETRLLMGRSQKKAWEGNISRRKSQSRLVQSLNQRRWGI